MHGRRSRVSGLAKMVMVGGVVSASLGIGAPSHAMSPEAFKTTTEKYTWLAAATAHAIQWETYAGGKPSPGYLPVGDVLMGVPYSRIQTTSAPGVSEGFASLAYPSYIVDEAFLDRKGSGRGSGDVPLEGTPTLTRCSNPTNLGRGQQKEADFGSPEAGPSAHAKCLEPDEVSSEATLGPVMGKDHGKSAGYGLANTRSYGKVSEDGVLTLEAFSSVKDLAFSGVQVALATTHLKLEWPAREEKPSISYHIQVTGITANGQSLLGAGNTISLAGNAVGGEDLTKQFRQQAAEASKLTKDVASMELLFVEPQVYTGQEREVTIQSPAFGIATQNAVRKGGAGEYWSVGLGFSRIYAHMAEAGPSQSADAAAGSPGAGTSTGGGGSYPYAAPLADRGRIIAASPPAEPVKVRPGLDSDEALRTEAGSALGVGSARRVAPSVGVGAAQGFLLMPHRALAM